MHADHAAARGAPEAEERKPALGRDAVARLHGPPPIVGCEPGEMLAPLEDPMRPRRGAEQLDVGLDLVAAVDTDEAPDPHHPVTGREREHPRFRPLRSHAHGLTRQRNLDGDAPVRVGLAEDRLQLDREQGGGEQDGEAGREDEEEEEAEQPPPETGAHAAHHLAASLSAILAISARSSRSVTSTSRPDRGQRTVAVPCSSIVRSPRRMFQRARTDAPQVRQRKRLVARLMAAAASCFMRAAAG